MQPYPLLLTPPIKDYIWGGSRLKTEFGFDCPGDVAAEAWILSCHPDGPSVVSNGPLAGKTLAEALAEFGSAAIGEKAAAFPDFPILIKLIDARTPLSIQVHPNDEYAAKADRSMGKTEMWYVVDCQPDAKLIYGFNTRLTSEEFRARIENGTLEEVCNQVPVHKGDVFFIEAGTLHAIGAGILIAEVQQNSNSTYRVYDYGRLGADGKPRPLHIDKAVDVTVTAPPSRPYGHIGEETPIPGGTCRPLASCDLFNVQLLRVDGSLQAGCLESFTSLVCLDGSCTLEAAGHETLSLKKGSSAFLPAGMIARLQGSAQLLCSRI
jgi:phosphomannose isomerase type I